MWKTVGASVIGTSHVRLGLNCQDAHDYTVIDQFGVVAAVADGLGSAKMSEFGARIASQTMVKILANLIAEEKPKTAETCKAYIYQAFLDVRDHIRKKADHDGHLLRDYATTLIVAIISSEFLFVAHVGDGAVVCQFDDGELELLSSPQRGEFANEVIPVTNRYAIRFIRYGFSKRQIKVLAMLSDGLQSISLDYAKSSPHRPFFEPIFKSFVDAEDVVSFKSDIEKFLGSERVCAKTDDDKTLLMIYRNDMTSQQRDSNKWQPTQHHPVVLSPQVEKLPTGEKDSYLESMGKIKLPRFIARIIALLTKKIN